MVVVVGVRFKRAGKIYYFDPDGLDINVGDAVIVETVRGVEYGDVVIGVKEVDESHIVAPLKKVLRIADPMDKATVIENKEKASQAMKICQEKIDFHNLPMKLIDVEYTFDNTKLIFYFTADGRVDFRELVKDLAAVFKTRIELRQIGVRDEAKMLGGLGPCGRALCCTTFLGDFVPVSIRMAKEQNLSLNLLLTLSNLYQPLGPLSLLSHRLPSLRVLSLLLCQLIRQLEK
jgi:cell fate regulator YaaT (PSP1 superfamily)